MFKNALKYEIVINRVDFFEAFFAYVLDSTALFHQGNCILWRVLGLIFQAAKVPLIIRVTRSPKRQISKQVYQQENNSFPIKRAFPRGWKSRRDDDVEMLKEQTRGPFVCFSNPQDRSCRIEISFGPLSNIEKRSFVFCLLPYSESPFHLEF